MSGVKKSNAGWLLLGAALAAVGAPAQEAQAQSSETAASAPGEIIVTARRRAESLQDVPVAVTAFSADKLEAVGAQDITALTRATPNVTFEVSRGTNSTLTAFIRGVGQQDPVWGFEPGVGLYVDDVYIARPQGALLDIFDIDRIEVLRGPQGTLYGRNTIGGAIKYVTRRLGDEPVRSIKASYGSYDQRDLVLSGSTPITDTIAVGGAIAILTRDGFGQNVVTGAQHYDKDLTAGRVTVEWTPSDALFVRAAYDKTDDDSNAKHGYRQIASRDGVFQPLSGLYDTRATAGDKNSVETQGASLQVEYTVNDALTLKSITAYRDGETTTPIDFDGLPRRDLDVPAVYQDEQFSQELQALVKLDRVSGVVGVYYLNGIASGAFETILGTLIPGGFTAVNIGKVNTLSTSVFGDFTFDLTDQWALSVGGRYTSDQKTGLVIRREFLGVGTPVVSRNNAAVLFNPATNFRNSRTDEKFSPRVSLAYKPTQDLNLYASYSQGFKSGGFDPRANISATPAPLRPRILAGFEPEVIDSYEIGAKGNFFDDRLTLNTAVFFSDYTDQQVTVQQGVDTNGDGINDNIVSSVFNAGKTEYLGVEIEGALRITPAFTTTFALGYIDADVKEVLSNGVNLQTDAVKANDFVAQNTPEWTAQVGGNYRVTLPNDGKLDFNGAVSYRDEYFIFNTVVNQGFAPGVLAAFPQGGKKLDADAVTLLDLSTIYTAPSGRWTFGIYGRNLTDERYKVALYNFLYGINIATGAVGTPTGVDSSYSSFFGPPRTITGTFTVKF